MNVSLRFAAIWVADFGLQAIFRTDPTLKGQPVALLDGEDRKAVVMQMSVQAKEQGIEKGMTGVQAMARCGSVVLRARQKTIEAEAQAALLAVAWTLSPRVETFEEGGCLIDLAERASEALASLAEAALAQLGALGLAATIGIARTPLLALYAARQTKTVLAVEDETEFLAELPLEMAGPTPEQSVVLKNWGIHKMGALTRLSKQSIGRRLGRAGVELWERAKGEAERPLVPVNPPEKFNAALDWEHEIDTLDPLLFVLRRFVDRICLQLTSAGWVAQELQLCLRMADENHYRRDFKIPDPTANPDVLMRVLHTHLEGVQTDSAITAVQLEILPTRSLVKQRGLFDASLRDPHGFAESLARVSAIVGSERMGTPRVEESHRPDAVVMEPMMEALPDLAPKPTLPPVGLPLRRYRPLVTALVELKGDGAPSYLRSSVVQGEIRAHRGPWRKSGDWWHPLSWSREEWDVELCPGGLFRLIKTETGWFVEGMYD